MTLFATSPIDSGEIFAPEIVETAVIRYGERYDEPTGDIADRGDGTRRMPDFLALAPLSPIPAGHTDQHAAIVVPDTIGIYPPTPLPSPGRHALTERVGLYPVVRPTMPLHSGIRAERRAAARRDRRARWATVLLLAALVATVALLAAIR